MTTEQAQEEQQQQAAAEKGLGKGAKWGIGCGIGCLVIILLLAAAGLVGWGVVRKMVRQQKSELAGMGFTRDVTAHVVEHRDNISEKTLFTGQVVKLFGNSSTDVAVLAQQCEVHGRIDGKLYFRGQMLVIQPGAVVAGGLDLKAQVVQVYGKVEGEVTGTYQMYDDRSKTAPSAE